MRTDEEEQAVKERGSGHMNVNNTGEQYSHSCRSKDVLT